MNLISLSPKTKSIKEEKKENVLSAFRIKKDETKGIIEGMSPQEIAEIISNRLMEIINKQIEDGKDKFLKGK